MRNASLMSLVASALRRLELVGAMYLGSVIAHMLLRTAKTGELLTDRWKAAYPPGRA